MTASQTARTSGDRRTTVSSYDRAAEESAAVVIRRFSTSFGLASRLLDGPVRTHVRNIYALVRVADEIVDGPVDAAGPTPERRADLLAGLEEDTYDALRTRMSANLVVHAFARTADECGIDPVLIRPFFASMATDLQVSTHDAESFARYVYGSAEVVGLMCLRVFLTMDGSAHRYDALAPGARCLGAAFQKVNFLRDLAEDHGVLGRSYFPGLDVPHLSAADRDRILDDVDADLAGAAAVIGTLPDNSRAAVATAHALFSELSRRLRDTSPEDILAGRVRVPAPVKAWLAVSAWRGARR